MPVCEASTGVHQSLGECLSEEGMNWSADLILDVEKESSCWTDTESQEQQQRIPLFPCLAGRQCASQTHDGLTALDNYGLHLGPAAGAAVSGIQAGAFGPEPGH